LHPEVAGAAGQLDHAGFAEQPAGGLVRIGKRQRKEGRAPGPKGMARPVLRDQFDGVAAVNDADVPAPVALADGDLEILHDDADRLVPPGAGALRVNAAKVDDRSADAVGGGVNGWRVWVGSLSAQPRGIAHDGPNPEFGNPGRCAAPDDFALDS